jgi:hypothetical protein
VGVNRPSAWVFVAVVSLLGSSSLLVVACGKDKTQAARNDIAVTAPQGADCGHTSCGSNFFVDGAQGGDCAAGATCTVALKLVATGDYHINDEYPYKFKADGASGVTFLGTDTAGTSVFSKAANNWQKTGPQTGVMNVSFQATDKGSKNLTGTFKLSVCSAANCQLEQQQVSTPVAIK